MSEASTHSHAAGDHHSHDHARGANKRALWLVLALTGTYMVAEVVGGLLTGSLALLADAGHMLTDNVALALALGAFWLSERPPTPERSFGYKRVEILAALFNGLTLVAISGWILFEAVRRIREPAEVLGGWMLAVAAVGLLVNAAGAVILSRSAGENLNMQGALRHVLADLAGSVGVILAAVAIMLTGWVYADPLVSVAIALLVLLSSWRLLRESVSVLLEAAPAGMKVEEIGAAMVRVEGVREVHDLHVWTITSGFPALAAHVLVGERENCHARRREIEAVLLERFGISHTTLQVDHVGDHPAAGQRLRFTGRTRDSAC
ncbi:CDF: cation diffusion facilitator family transporter [Rubrobacter radiotolerans]|uniref:Cation diffusion facilitator family transporter n=1 Tax=Rubrobacter radiotolerans TaxID=42256 RepID=A0A023X2K2_RUBRA|nr:cation diffusion facilitator family transporter [Rubrobacter radiotolerans]AHY46441.1 CDF: cation diffusion facilitator family transporter [Rubrobacter radiotolerans]MDX5893848.1 cation diffusion facilitator family transporter [Rubrobacter radiotolerans]